MREHSQLCVSDIRIDFRIPTCMLQKVRIQWFLAKQISGWRRLDSVTTHYTYLFSHSMRFLLASSIYGLSSGAQSSLFRCTNPWVCPENVLIWYSTLQCSFSFWVSCATWDGKMAGHVTPRTVPVPHARLSSSSALGYKQGLESSDCSAFSCVTNRVLKKERTAYLGANNWIQPCKRSLKNWWGFGAKA